MTIAAVVRATGVIGPGLADWTTARAVLNGAADYRDEPVARPRTGTLPRTEARRATDTIHLALAAAEQVMADPPAGEMAAVFASADGDLDTVERMCRSAAEAEPWISPHRFHNSVHNAPSGYWSIASGCRGPNSTISAGDGSFAAGLAEALTVLNADPADGEECLFVAYDQAAPPAFAPVHAVGFPFAIALRLARAGAGPSLRLTRLGADERPTPCAHTGLERLRTGNPAARGLPLLTALAADKPLRVHLPAPAGMLTLDVGDRR